MSQLQQIQKEIKKNILDDYLNGMDVNDIAKKYSYKHPRNVYYHLGSLTFSQKITHLKNKLSRLNAEGK